MPDKTFRQQIVDLLSAHPASISELARTLEAKFADVAFALEHIEKSIKPRKIKIIPAGCRQCGFVFRERKKFTPPSRCPECKSEWLTEAVFSIS
jgi:predicted Zn-ribbon and HTH transcriptional regulator